MPSLKQPPWTICAKHLIVSFRISWNSFLILTLINPSASCKIRFKFQPEPLVFFILYSVLKCFYHKALLPSSSSVDFRLTLCLTASFEFVVF